VRLVFFDDDSDLLLLQQLSDIPRAFRPYFMGAPASHLRPCPPCPLRPCARPCFPEASVVHAAWRHLDCLQRLTPQCDYSCTGSFLHGPPCCA